MRRRTLPRLTARIMAVGGVLILLGGQSARASAPAERASAAAPRASASAAHASASAAHASASAAGGSGRKASEISFVLPVAGPALVLTPFLPPAFAYGRGHRGVDLAGVAGSSIRAAGGGVVVYAGQLAGRGVISIDHLVGDHLVGDRAVAIRTTYQPVTASVAAGQRVVAGQQIGVLHSGHPSCAPAACLHWGARLPNGSYLDPMGLLGALPVRLFPWVE
jgi:murein DD-endopeptidase MepM/ murein hydrolase activator NlpD